MSLTPTALIAVSGLMNGEGLQINSGMVTQITNVTTNSLITSFQSALTNAGGVCTINTLPAFITQASSTASNVMTQAEGMLPGPGSIDPTVKVQSNKNFISLFNGASSFIGSMAAEYSAALAQFGDKAFSDLGVGVKDFTGVLSGGVTNLIPAAAGGLTAVINQAKKQGFDTLTPQISPDTLRAGADILNNGLASIGTSLKNFGGAYDFTNLATVGTPGALVASLQKQGLGDSLGVNEAIQAAGYDPLHPELIPAGVLTPIISSIQGEDLKKVTSMLGMSPAASMNTLADACKLESFMPKDVMASMGLDKSASGMTNFTNSLTNMGLQIDNMKMGDFLGTIKTQSFPNLESVTQVVPDSVKSTLAPYLGTGSGIFGNPTMSDMLGTVAGVVHTDTFKAMNDAIVATGNSPSGQALVAAMSTLAADPGNAAKQTAANVAVANFNATISSNPAFSAAATAANAALTETAAHLAKEVSNLALAGKSLVVGTPDLGPGMNSILSFGTRLHSMGVDKTNAGFNKILESITSNSLTGDAIRATLMEGRNLAHAAVVGKTTPAVANPTEEAKLTTNDQLATFEEAVTEAQYDYNNAYQVYLSKPSDPGVLADLQYYQTKLDDANAALTAARNIAI